MSLAKQCDRCGRFYRDEPIQIGKIKEVNSLGLITTTHNNSSYGVRHCYDLCPDCLESLSDWIKNDK